MKDLDSSSLCDPSKYFHRCFSPNLLISGSEASRPLDLKPLNHSIANLFMFEVYDGETAEGTVENYAADTRDTNNKREVKSTSKKRKQEETSEESEDGENDSDGHQDEANGESAGTKSKRGGKSSSRGRGKGAMGSGRGRGRGRPKSDNNGNSVRGRKKAKRSG